MVKSDDASYRKAVGSEIEVWQKKRPSRVIATLAKPAQFFGSPITKLLETELGKRIMKRAIEAFFDVGIWRFSSRRIFDSYRARGYQVADLADIRRQVPLRAMDDEAKRHWVAATTVLTVEGGIVGVGMAVAAGAAGAAAAASAVASGGGAGPPAAAAGLAVVASGAAIETAFLIGYCCRRLAAIAACYGFDVANDGERLFALQVFNVATAENLQAKEDALADLGNLAGRLALTKQPWKNLENQSWIARLTRELAQRLGRKLTQDQLRRALTVIGALMGAGFNGHLGHTTTRAAYMLYRQRVLDEDTAPQARPFGGAEQPVRVPSPVAEAVADWRARDMPAQRAVRWRREAWVEAFPRQREMFLALPDKLDRRAVHDAIARIGRNDGWVMSAFLISQAWGYAERGYGPSRVGALFEGGTETATHSLQAAATMVEQEGPVSAFRALAGQHKIKGLGTAFATKFLYFADPHERALILDDFIAEWLRENADLRLTVQPMNVHHYERYLETMAGWSEALSLEPALLEEVLFSAAAASRPGSSWGG